MRIYCVFVLISCMACASLKHSSVDIDLLPVIESRESSSHMGRIIVSDKNPFVIDTANPHHTPRKNLRVNFHFVNTSDSTHNFKEDSGRIFIYQLLKAMQVLFDNNDKMRLPRANDIPVLPVNIKYVLQSQRGDEGIYFHYDNALAYYNHMGALRNNSDYTIVEKYGIGVDSIINIFILPHHPDSMRSNSYQRGCVGIAMGNAIKIAGIYENKLNAMNVRGTFNHEVGHILGLYHAWADDGCDDTPMHDNRCWADAAPGCNGKTSNNMMDYNAFQSALTPCQLDIIHSNLSNVSHPNRNLLIKSWCSYDKYKKIIITDSILWASDRDLECDVEIKPNATLKIKCRVSMAPGSKIMIHPGGKLILENCTLHNDCNNTWNGISVLTRSKKKGEIIKMKNVIIKDVAQSVQ